MKTIERYSLGTGDRFGRQCAAQIAAVKKAREAGIDVAIVWNKSHREHLLAGTVPADQGAAAVQAVRETGWDGPWYVDADHIGMTTVERFAPYCNFFTIDVADFIGKSAAPEAIAAFTAKHADLAAAKGIPARLDAAAIQAAAERYLHAVEETAKTYRRICELRKGDDFVTEVSMDETAIPQTPAELIVILAALADAGVPVQAIAPKYSGRFNKGVDYVGDVAAFLKEFEADVRVAKWCAEAFGLPKSLKLSIHTGSDKFSLYRGIGRIIRQEETGVHLKTAGTTWLEEIVGLAESGGDGLAMAKEIYRAAYDRFAEVVAPYVEVIDIDQKKLPSPDEVDRWDGPALVAAVRHVQTDQRFNPMMRQLFHVGFAVVASMGQRFYEAVEKHKAAVSRNVTVNLWERHIVPLFIG
ncbi:MAG: tagaturonate epimerase family protein [Deltaproteobacteria bacterium]|nr:tagaturonate epimerase family protein [Deltaproteobacteria bacterium]